MVWREGEMESSSGLIKEIGSKKRYWGKNHRPLKMDIVEARIWIADKGWRDGDWVRFLEKVDGEEKVMVLVWTGEEWRKREWSLE